MFYSKRVIGASKFLKEKTPVVQFNPSDKKLYLQMPGDECYYQTHGTCPIRDGNININCRCSELLKDLTHHNQDGTIELSQDATVPVVHYDPLRKAYSFTDGQHRTCIAQQLGMDIMVDKNISEAMAHYEHGVTLITPLSK